LVFTPENLDFLLENIKFLQKIGFRWIEFYPEMYTLWTKEKLIRMKEIFKKFRNYYISLFLKNKKELIFKNSLLDSIVNKDEVVGTINIKCQKIHLAPDGNFYFCDKVFSLPENERKKYIIGNVLEGIDNEKRLFLIENFRKKIIKLLGKKCNKCPAKEYCFCPIGHYIYFSFKKLNLKRYFLSFCSVAKIYFDTFWKIKERLIYNPLFANIYKF
jgi:radical SAM protein with 4Fe4S-binding SPASM domain